MLTTVPIYPLCEAYGNDVIASIQNAYPALEARATNADIHGPITIEARNPLNGDCWTTVGAIGPVARNPDNIEIMIGNDPCDNPVARFAGPVKKAPDSPSVCRTFVEYIRRERAKHEKEVARKQAINASVDAATKLTKKAKRAGIPLEGEVPHLAIVGRNDSHWDRMTLPPDVVAVTVVLPNITATPEQAEQILKLWRPLGKYLTEIEPIKKQENSCPAAGTLVN